MRHQATDKINELNELEDIRKTYGEQYTWLFRLYLKFHKIFHFKRERIVKNG